MSHKGTVEIAVISRSLAEIYLEVKYSISGSYHPGRTHGDPDSCYPPEYPEIELESDLAKIQTKKGNWISYNLKKLNAAEYAQVIKKLPDLVLGSVEQDHEPDDRDDFSNDSWQDGQDKWERDQGI